MLNINPMTFFLVIMMMVPSIVLFSVSFAYGDEIEYDRTDIDNLKDQIEESEKTINTLDNDIIQQRQIILDNENTIQDNKDILKDLKKDNDDSWDSILDIIEARDNLEDSKKELSESKKELTALFNEQSDEIKNKRILEKDLKTMYNKIRSQVLEDATITQDDNNSNSTGLYKKIGIQISSNCINMI